MASRILLADDSITIQKVVNLTFADEGIEVVAVSNGDQAERRLADVNPDLVLADIFMPGKNGYELCEAIKESAQFRNVPVVLLVGAFEPFDQTEARRVRADAHLTKPFESRTLVETVRRLISARPRTITAPIAPMPAADARKDEGIDARVGSTVEAPLFSQVAPTLELSAMADSTPAAPSMPQGRNTGELVSPSHDGPRFELGAADAPALEAVSATLTDTSKRFEPLEASPNGVFSSADVIPTFDLGARDPQVGEVNQDFDTPEMGEDGASQDPISFETGPIASFEVNNTSTSEGASWFSPGSTETAGLNRQAGDGAWRVPSNGSALSYPSPDFKLQTETGYSASEASTDTACATMLAVDEPLGDVLFDDAVSEQLAASEMSSSDLLGLGLMEAEVADSTPPVSTQFDLVDLGDASTAEVSTAEVPTAEVPTAELSTAEVSTAEVPTAESSTAEVSTTEVSTAEVSTAEASPADVPMAEATTESSMADVSTANESMTEASQPELSTAEVSFTAEGNQQVVEPLVTEETPAADKRQDSGAAEQHLDSQTPSHRADNDLDWTTPRAAAYSTAQLESVVMPIATAEYLAASEAAPQPEADPQPESTEEASFTTPTMWTEEEARFTPIDIEAVSVEAATVNEDNAAEHGFEFSSVPAEPDRDREHGVPVSAQQPVNGASAALSAAAIEEIVRRVVAEMSESVVREVAWEVVPDCVERVIEQLTRESLSKRA